MDLKEIIKNNLIKVKVFPNSTRTEIKSDDKIYNQKLLIE